MKQEANSVKQKARKKNREAISEKQVRTSQEAGVSRRLCEHTSARSVVYIRQEVSPVLVLLSPQVSPHERPQSVRLLLGPSVHHGQVYEVRLLSDLKPLCLEI